jgi:ABC-type transporter Mla subunit MlaD
MKPQNQFLETLITILGVLAVLWLVLNLLTFNAE